MRNDSEKKYSVDSIRVGKCHAGEELETCSGGCNDKGLGSGCAQCSAGALVKVSIRCEGGTNGIELSTTCKGNAKTNLLSSIVYL